MLTRPRAGACLRSGNGFIPPAMAPRRKAVLEAANQTAQDQIGDITRDVLVMKAQQTGLLRQADALAKEIKRKEEQKVKVETEKKKIKEELDRSNITRGLKKDDLVRAWLDDLPDTKPKDKKYVGISAEGGITVMDGTKIARVKDWQLMPPAESKKRKREADAEPNQGGTQGNTQSGSSSQDDQEGQGGGGGAVTRTGIMGRVSGFLAGR